MMTKNAGRMRRLKTKRANRAITKAKREASRVERRTLRVSLKRDDEADPPRKAQHPLTDWDIA